MRPEMNQDRYAAQIVANGNRYVKKHGTCCGLRTRRYGCASHGQPPASGYLRDANGRQFVWVLGRRTVGQPAPRVKFYI